MFKSAAVLSVALASGKNKYTFSQDTADLSFYANAALLAELLDLFRGRRKILGCLPEWRNSTEQTSLPVLALLLRQALTQGCLPSLCWEGGVWPDLLVGLPGRWSEGEGGRHTPLLPPPRPRYRKGTFPLT